MSDSGHEQGSREIPDEGRSRSPFRSKRVWWIIAAGILGIAMFIGVIAYAGPERVGAIRDADPAWIAFTFAAGLGVTTVSTYRWGYLTNVLANRAALPWTQYYAALLSSRVLGLFVPRNASDIGVRIAVLMGPGKLGGEFATASVALDQLFDITLLAVWLLPSILLLGTLPAGWGYVLVPLSLIVSFALMLQLSAAIRWAARLLERLARVLSNTKHVGGFFTRRAAGLRDLAEIEHFTRSQSLRLAIATVLRYVLNALMFWAIAQSLGLGIDLWFFLLAGTIVQLSLVIAFTPGGLGLMDLGWVGALVLGGFGAGTGAAFVVGVRAFQYVFFPLLAAISYLVAVATRSAGGKRPSAGPESTTHD